jgi:nucleotide-binding universal stress UspA family protein
MYREILIHIDGSTRAATRLELAVRFARQIGGRLTGVFAQIDPDERGIIAQRPSDRLGEVAAAAEELFRQSCATHALDCDWMRLPFGEHNFIIRELAICSRYYDLTVLGQFDPETDHRVVPAELNEEIVLQSGGPVLIVPFAGTFDSVGKRVMVAWNGSREAARAVRDALPILEAAERVNVLGLHLRTAQADAELPRVNIVERLKSQGIQAGYDVVAPSSVGTMDMVLSGAADIAADLIVMGGFGQYVFPSFSRGAGTRYILRHMTVPVLMSH